jgi:deazaflavin-dependent oxidoreductase (nitroreductase family)
VNDFNANIIEEFRANDGVVGGMFEGMPMVLLTTTGAKSGQQRTHPLARFDIDGRRFVIASKGGAPTNPAWFHNIVANPTVTVELGSETYEATAAPVGAEERERLYPQIVERQPGFGKYQEGTDRVIPIVELATE